MKVRPYERSTLWRSAFGKRRNDPDERDREALANAYRQLRDRAGDLVNEIHAILPSLTVHDLTHADALWDVASEICGHDFKLNPLEGFVLGASFLLHDAGMALAAYPNGLKDLEDSVEWRDAVISAWKSRGVDEPSQDQRTDPEEAIRSEATFAVLRSRHAEQAKSLVSALWKQPATGRPLALVQNDDLLESYGDLIGNISASHHWPLPEVARYFGDPTPASAAWPREWEVNSLLLACVLRCADACAIDETRAPSFLFALRKPEGESKRHWTFQNKIYPAKRREDALVFESKSPFSFAESDDWWLCFDSIEIADAELRGADAVLTDRRYQKFSVRRIIGSGNPEIFCETIKVAGWKPVNTRPRISNPQGIIEKLGGKQLYGDQPIVPIRELIQNAADAIRARRFLDPHFRSTEEDENPGCILLEINEVTNDDNIWIAVEDNGVGMSEVTLTRSLLDFGNSFWSSSAAAKIYPGLPSARNFRPIGRFGIGFFSVFMYSNLVRVFSREFKAARDSWGLLSFRRGVRGRADYSVEKSPIGLKNIDSSTRIEFCVKKGYLDKIIEDRLFYDDSRERDAQITDAFKELVVALDVKVILKFGNMAPMDLNDPPIYKKGADKVWDAIKGKSDWDDDERRSAIKKRLLSPMNDESGQCFGYCALNVAGYSTRQIFRSVGGIVTHESYGVPSPIIGIAEFDVEAANRSPRRLMAPEQVMRNWVQEQISRISIEDLNDSERMYAAVSVAKLTGDIRPLFYVKTNEGGMKLENLVERILNVGSVVVPVRFRSEALGAFHSDLPTVADEVNLSDADIKFTQLTIVPFANFSATISNNNNGVEEWSFSKNDYSGIWQAVVNAVREKSKEVSAVYLKDYVIGSYVGLDSLRHNLKNGASIQCDVVQLHAR